MTSMPPSLWARTAIAGPECPPLDSAEECDTVIVGAGYTGCSAALHLAREGRVVRVLEAAEPGWGCSGRNGGQVNPGGTRATPEEIIEVLGKEWGERFIVMGHETCDLVFELIDRYRIKCDAFRPGYVQGGWGNTGVEYERGLGGPMECARRRDPLARRARDPGAHWERSLRTWPLRPARGQRPAAVLRARPRERRRCGGGCHPRGIEGDPDRAVRRRLAGDGRRRRQRDRPARPHRLQRLYRRPLARPQAERGAGMLLRCGDRPPRTQRVAEGPARPACGIGKRPGHRLLSPGSRRSLRDRRSRQLVQRRSDRGRLPRQGGGRAALPGALQASSGSITGPVGPR